MDILLHNLSHADLLLGVVTSAKAGDVLIVRPKFSKFHTLSKSLYDHIIHNMAAIKIVNSPLHNRRDNGCTSESESVPIGFDLRDAPATCDIRDVRFRKELPPSEEDATDACSVHFIYFPLLAVLLKRWQQHTRFAELHLILVSGRGQPIDQSSQELDNSTQFTGHLVDEFVKRTLERAHLTVHLIHSDTNLFRYDENILFVKRELLPQIHELRRTVVAQRKDKWRDFMRMTLSFADGSSARISAINQSLKIYQPAYMHFWSLKSFWREQRIYEDDVEFHMFEEIATEPAMRLKDLTDPLVLKAVAEIDSFHREFEAVAARDDNDLRAFWLRKTMKAVLAVLIVQHPATGELLAYRGTNLEVSLPTGSLCAERNAIGTAFAANMALKREDIKLVAVYSAAIEDKPKRRKDSDAADTTAAASAATAAAATARLEAPVHPTSAAAAATGDVALLTPRVNALQRQASTNARTRAILGINDAGLGAAGGGSALSPSHQRANGTPATTVTSPTSPAAAKRPLSQLMPSPPAALTAAAAAGPVSDAAGAQPLRKRRKTIPFSSPEAVPASHHHSVASAGSSTNLTALSDGTDAASAAAVADAPPLCVASSVDALLLGAGANGGDWACEGRAHASNLATMETIETGENDLNPLKPCGTCTSWLQKIVKCNPDFRVVTFTDARRQGIYVEYIQE